MENAVNQTKALNSASEYHLAALLLLRQLIQHTLPINSVCRKDEEKEACCKRHQANSIHVSCRTSAGAFTNDKTISI